MNGLTPIIIAIISVVGILVGYMLERRKQREFEINKIRKELYVRLIKNLIEVLELFEKMKRKESLPEQITRGNVDDIYALIVKKYPELSENFKQFREIMTLMSVYATDKAIKACVEFAQESISILEKDLGVQPNIGKLILSLRRTLFPKTGITPKDINLIMSK